jgi:hypothetical protein
VFNIWSLQVVAEGVGQLLVAEVLAATEQM